MSALSLSSKYTKRTTNENSNWNIGLGPACFGRKKNTETDVRIVRHIVFAVVVADAAAAAVRHNFPAES